MKKMLTLSLMLFSYALVAETPTKKYSDVLFNSKTMVEKFNKKKCCKPSSKNKEAVKTSAVESSKKEAKAVTCLVPYRIANKDQYSAQKMLSFNEIFTKIDINNVPVTCKKKDPSVLLASSDKQVVADNANKVSE